MHAGLASSVGGYWGAEAAFFIAAAAFFGGVGRLAGRDDA